MSHRVEYDALAAGYDRRYAVHEYGGVEKVLAQFVAARPAAGPGDRVAALEVGCGTGHWLAVLGAAGCRCAGVDPSRGMLTHARTAAPAASLVQARAESLPWRPASFDRVIVVKALHHFTALDAFIAEARRVLRPGGGLITIGLDPHTGLDQWWIYDHFPSAVAADRTRYPAAAALRERHAAAGFQACQTIVAQHWAGAVSVADAETRGLLERTSTSQLLVIPDAEYEAGVVRIQTLEALAGEPAPLLRADLRLYATSGWLPS
jgi:ubiquinone/menaquinone biosynthesis C-methylase UbiE